MSRTRLPDDGKFFIRHNIRIVPVTIRAFRNVECYRNESGSVDDVTLKVFNRQTQHHLHTSMTVIGACDPANRASYQDDLFDS